MFEYNGVKISWLGHASFRLSNGRVVYIDPFKIKPAVPADVVLITHEHYDHCSLEDVQKIVKPNTIVVTTAAAQDKLRSLKSQFIIVVPGKQYSIDGIKIEAVKAYNVNKFRSENVTYHPEKEGKVGFIVTINGVRIYHAGDTDVIPDMKTTIKDIDVALLPISGTYVMTVKEAVKAVEAINPKVAIPMHYGAIVGEKSDAIEFRHLVKTSKVEILEEE